MENDSNYPADAVSNRTKTGKRSLLLIPRSHRRWFFAQFTLATLVGWVLGGIASIFLERNLQGILPLAFASQPQILSYLTTNFSTGLFAIIFALFQGLLIRRYLSFWWWTIATSMGWLIFLNVAEAWKNYILSPTVLQSLPAERVLGFSILSTIAYNVAAIWLGLLQWLVIRQRVIGAWWWTFLPSGIFFTISIFMWLLSLLQEFIPEINRTQILYLSGQGFTAVILGVIPAIALCNLKIKPKIISTSSHSSS
ncbi:MAG: hypothetical protein QNJ36_18850 [Calothrix sp. MO_167.B42]|nr:hypothetical protein [Calothrix sp. MO_167.B42]